MTERERIFQQAMENCHSSNPMDCIEWFADRIAELEAVYKKALEDVVKLSDEKKEAKEIIKDLLEYFPTGFRTSTERKRAEQFIKE